jgi:hypothetical protein
MLDQDTILPRAITHRLFSPHIVSLNEGELLKLKKKDTVNTTSPVLTPELEHSLALVGLLAGWVGMDGIGINEGRVSESWQPGIGKPRIQHRAPKCVVGIPPRYEWT